MDFLKTCILAAALIIPALITPVHSDEEYPAMDESRLDIASDRYQTGTYLVYGGLLAGAMAEMSHDPGIAISLHAASVLLQYGGLPWLGNAAFGYCKEASPKNDCGSPGWPMYWLSLSGRALFYYELMDIAVDDSKNRRADPSKALIGVLGGITSVGAYLYSWYSFHKVKRRGEDSLIKTSFIPELKLDADAGCSIGVKLSVPLL